MLTVILLTLKTWPTKMRHFNSFLFPSLTFFLLHHSLHFPTVGSNDFSDLEVATWMPRILRSRLRFFRAWRPTPTSTVTRLHGSRTFRTTWPTLRRMCCSNYSSQSTEIVNRARLYFKPPLFSFGFISHSGVGRGHLVLRVCSRQHRKGEIQGARACLYFFLSFLSAFLLCASYGMFGSLTTRTLLH